MSPHLLSTIRYQRTRSVFRLNCSVTWLQQTFSEADKNGDGTLSIGEVHQLLHKLNVNLPKQKVRQMFQVRLEATGYHRLNTLDPPLWPTLTQSGELENVVSAQSG